MMESSSSSEKRKADGEVDNDWGETLKKLKSADVSVSTFNPELLLLTKSDRKDVAEMHLNRLDGTEICSFTQKGRLEKGLLGNHSKILIVHLLQRHNKNHHGVYGWNINDLNSPLYGLYFKYVPHIGMNSSGTVMAMTWETHTMLPLTVYDALTGAKLYDFPSSHLNMHPSFSFDDANIFSCTSTELKLWECETRSCRTILKFTKGYKWTSITVCHSSLPLVAMSSSRSQIVVWDYSTEAEVFRKDNATLFAASYVLFIDENKILFCGNGRLELWNFAASVCIVAIESRFHPSRAGIVFDPISNLIWAPLQFVEEIVIALDPLTGTEVNRFAIKNKIAGIFCGIQTNILM